MDFGGSGSAGNAFDEVQGSKARWFRASWSPLLDPWTIAGIGEIDVEIVTNPLFSTFVSASMLGRNHKCNILIYRC